MDAAAQSGPRTSVRVTGPDDERLLAGFYARWSPFVYSVALRGQRDVEAAEETTQRVFTRAWSAGRAFQTDDGPAPGWLVDIVRDEVAVPADDLAEQVSALEGLERLEAGPRQALRLALHEDLDHREIAERMQQSAADIRSHLRRGLEALRNRLEVQTGAR